MNKPIKVELKTKPSKPAYEFAQMNDYLQATLSLPKLTYMMDGYICLGQLTFLFGPEKVGKTPIAMEMALNMAKGEKHFGHFRNDAGPVPTLYLDNELQARNLRKRFSSDEEQLMLHKFPDNFYRLQPDKAVTGLMSDKEIMDATLEAIEDARINSNIQKLQGSYAVKDMQDLINTLESGTAGDQTMLGMARIWRVVIFHRLTDMYGDIPYFEALTAESASNFNPKYDSQKEVYMSLIDKVDEAITLLEEVESTSMGVDDII